MMWAYVDVAAGEEISKEEGNDRLAPSFTMVADAFFG